MSWLRSRLLLGTAALLALAACDKGTDLGVDLPDAAEINADYLNIRLTASTVQYDSLETLKSDHFMAGRLRDNVAGLSTATAVLNLQASTLTDSLPTPTKFPGAVLDSVVFTQGFDVVYGSSSTPASFDLIRTAASLSETGRYTSSTVPQLGLPAAENLTTRLDRLKAVVDTTCKCTTYVADPAVRLLLFSRTRGINSGRDYSTRLFGAMASNATVFGQTQLDALEQGLAIVPSQGYDKAIVSFGRNASSRLAFYFHEPVVAAKWHSYALYVGPSPSGSGAALARDPKYYTYIQSDLSGTPLAALSDPTKSVPAADLGGVSYVQDGIGLGTKLEFDAGLAPLRDAQGQVLPGLAINRAELYIPVKPNTNALLPAANGLFALEVNTQNQVLRRTVNLAVVDRLVQADAYSQLGANNEGLALLVDGNTSAPYYRLSLTSYLQAYLKNQLDGALPAALVLLPTVRRSQNLTLNRSTLQVDATRDLRLRVYYSKLR